MLALRQISKTFSTSPKSREVLKDISYEMQGSEIVAVLGPNGCGKTTLLKILAGFERPSTGFIEWNHSESLHPTRGFLFQQAVDSLFPWQTVEEHLQFGFTHASPKKTPHLTPNQILERLRLTEHRKKYPYQLSGGLQQLVALGRVWAMHPHILILDEAFSALDYYTTIRIEELFLDLWEERKIPTWFVTHSIDQAIYLADRILILSSPPASIVCEIKVPLPRPRRFADRSDPTFSIIRREILNNIRGFL